MRLSVVWGVSSRVILTPLDPSSAYDIVIKKKLWYFDCLPSDVLHFSKSFYGRFCVADTCVVRYTVDGMKVVELGSHSILRFAIQILSKGSAIHHPAGSRAKQRRLSCRVVV
uniref:Uncharacterized protein n=1 Tax=Grammatophora oceanica TaxID=210454 RepID=A0A7S1VBG9_9STRA|mmetsp:Transcript_42074/g.62284  ORF Transcript_42074/g.62284 Transcript_42074/m.62284 type:complete len:112 (+) Transcript_42074:2232-2567(+)